VSLGFRHSFVRQARTQVGAPLVWIMLSSREYSRRLPVRKFIGRHERYVQRSPGFGMRPAVTSHGSGLTPNVFLTSDYLPTRAMAWSDRAFLMAWSRSAIHPRSISPVNSKIPHAYVSLPSLVWGRPPRVLDGRVVPDLSTVLH